MLALSDETAQSLAESHEIVYQMEHHVEFELARLRPIQPLVLFGMRHDEPPNSVYPRHCVIWPE